MFFIIKCKQQTMIRKFTRQVTVHQNCHSDKKSKQRIKIMINERTSVFVFDVKYVGLENSDLKR